MPLKFLSAASPVARDVMPSPSVGYCPLLFLLPVPPHATFFMDIFS